jgi:hypothetical protein
VKRIEKFTCPVCDTGCKKHVRFVMSKKHQNKEVLTRVRVTCSHCTYRYESYEGGLYAERVFHICITTCLGPDADDPGFPRLIEMLQLVRDMRVKVIREARRLWGDRHGRAILETIRDAHPTNRRPLVTSLQTFLEENRINYPTLARRRPDEGEEIGRRKKGKNDSHGDDPEPGGARVIS